MQHHAPHQNVAFEGYYNKFDLPSGAHVVLVISKVHRANSNANAVTFTYIPKDSTKIYQKEYFVDELNLSRTNSIDNAFILDIPNTGYAKWHDDGSADFSIETIDFSFRSRASSEGIPWPTQNQTPEGLLVYLPLPLHWHVRSLASPCDIQMRISDYDLPAEDTSTKEAFVHQEKNWAYSFPSAHMWVHARESDKVVCCAGGEILGMNAFLVGYSSKDLNLTFRPPFALRVLGLGPFMSHSIDWETRTFELTVQTFRQKINIRASAPKDTFYSLAAPFPEGHRPNYLNQSLKATVEVRIYESSFFGPWRLLREDVFEKGGLEFGAAYYPLAGTEQRFN